MRVRPSIGLDATEDVLAEGKRLLELAFGVAKPKVEIVA